MYDIIKRQNGEAFAKAILHYDASLFEMDDLPRIVKFAGRNALPILGTLKQIKEGAFSNDKKRLKSPYELLAEAGYDAYYADTLEKQNAIQKYFAPGEELCTFRDSNRFKNFYIIHAVKKNVDEIKRADFVGREERQDEYGTSVISIQVYKGGGFISIKNRYNHKVENPDNTFDSDPDKIIEGLSDAIKKEFGTDFISLPGNYLFANGMILNYYSEYGGVYSGEGFYFRDGKLHEVNKDKEFLVNDYFLFDMQKKEFSSLLSPTAFYDQLYDLYSRDEDADEFVYMFNQEIKGKKLIVSQNKKEKRITLFADGEMLFSTYESVIDMLCLKKAECRETFPEKFLDMNLKYYDGVKKYRLVEYEESCNIPYTELPKPPVMKPILSQKVCHPARQAGRQNEGD